jgi:hypothetical protein
MAETSNEIQIRALVESWAKAAREQNKRRRGGHHTATVVTFDMPDAAAFPGPLRRGRPPGTRGHAVGRGLVPHHLLRLAPDSASVRVAPDIAKHRYVHAPIPVDRRGWGDEGGLDG